MRRFILAAGIAAATLTSAANAQETCEQRRDNRTVGTVGGAGIGAVLGGVIGGNALGAVLGAVGGGIAGNQLLKGPQDCQHAYGYYDNTSRWHPSRVDPAAATGFYDRDGRWIAGAPAGYYDRDGRWVASEANRGYRDSNGYYVPAGVPGYYAGGNYVAVQGQQGYGNDGRGGYQDRGEQRGYGNDGRGDQRNDGERGDQRGYGNQPGGEYAGEARDYRARIAFMGDRISRMVTNGAITQDQARQARRDLDQVNRQAASLPHRDGYLYPRGQATISARLDQINGRLHDSREEARRY